MDQYAEAVGREAKQTVGHPVDEGARVEEQVATHIARIGRTTSRIRNAMLFTASFESETRAKLNQSADTSR